MANALSPAQVVRVTIDEDTKTATVVVPERQLSLAIGKEGPERAAGRQADRLADRHQERGSDARGAERAREEPERAGARRPSPRLARQSSGEVRAEG